MKKVEKIGRGGGVGRGRVVKGTYRQYRKQANGSLESVGLDETACKAFLAMRDAADRARQAEMCDWFEDLADRANAEG